MKSLHAGVTLLGLGLFALSRFSVAGRADLLLGIGGAALFAYGLHRLARHRDPARARDVRARGMARMRDSETPTSAFFFLDSLSAVDACHRALCELTAVPPAEGGLLRYFARVRETFRKAERVVNLDHEFEMTWNGRRHWLLLRVHSHSPGKYEAELQLPGFIAVALEGSFGQGDDGRFGCEFMPHGFYD